MRSPAPVDSRQIQPLVAEAAETRIGSSSALEVEQGVVVDTDSGYGARQRVGAAATAMATATSARRQPAAQPSTASELIALDSEEVTSDEEYDML